MPQNMVNYFQCEFFKDLFHEYAFWFFCLQHPRPQCYHFHFINEEKIQSRHTVVRESFDGGTKPHSQVL